VLIAVNRGARPRSVPLDSALAAARQKDVLSGGRETGPRRDVSVAPGTTRVVALTPATGDFAGLVAAIEHAERQPENVEVLFVAEPPAALRASDQLVVVGSGPELGAWDPAVAPVMSVGDGGRLARRVMLPRRGAYGFKLAVRRASGEVVWEEGRNRYLWVGATDAPEVGVLRFR
jgi:hypothetical protein